MKLPIVSTIIVILAGFSLPTQADTDLVSLHKKQMAGQVLYHSGRVMVETAIIATVVEAGTGKWSDGSAFGFGGVALAGFISTQTGLLIQNISIQRYKRLANSAADFPLWTEYALGWLPALGAVGLTTLGSVEAGMDDKTFGATVVIGALILNLIKDALWIRNSVFNAKYVENLYHLKNKPDISFIPVYTPGGSKGIALTFQY